MLGSLSYSRVTRLVVPDTELSDMLPDSPSESSQWARFIFTRHIQPLRKYTKYLRDVSQTISKHKQLYYDLLLTAL